MRTNVQYRPGMLRLCLLWMLLFASAGARERLLPVVAPVPQGKFPPPWTRAIRVSIESLSVSDHRLWKASSGQFRAALKGEFPSDLYEVEVLCLSQGEKKIAVFRQNLHIRPETKKLLLNRLRFVEVLNL